MSTIQSKTIVFLTGCFVDTSGWDNWKAFFESKGYTTHAPAWPFKDAPAAVLRSRHPDADIASIRLTQLIDHFSDFIKKLPEKPILIGHSYGGLLTQLFVNRGLAAAGAAIHSVPPQGIIPLSFSFYKATWGPLGFFTDVRKTFMMSFEQWQYAFTNGMPLEEQKAAYDANCIPESKHVSRDGLSSAAKVDFKKPHVPLLILAGDKDNIMPQAVNYANYKKYPQNNGSVTTWKVFPGRNHFVIGQPSWQEDAAFIADWIAQH
ncbi:alpha/beta hydrolase [Chitinophaga arvensicola]|uniref:Pimeloyl-ACP methyl ester carboxylesterase n=1 Tax=Chitinophaga arvensicola TaxID=29529 RepID=A0A1I0S9R6_9BACT|nr:alpha/beta hydrolase [Chitinophaga arvensicola]SEW52941.1 Pimeloyl-ACP methyl ester carboxylesterase [Chitinophaga arvensicola]